MKFEIVFGIILFLYVFFFNKHRPKSRHNMAFVSCIKAALEKQLFNRMMGRYRSNEYNRGRLSCWKVTSPAKFSHNTRAFYLTYELNPIPHELQPQFSPNSYSQYYIHTLKQRLQNKLIRGICYKLIITFITAQTWESSSLHNFTSDITLHYYNNSTTIGVSCIWSTLSFFFFLF